MKTFQAIRDLNTGALQLAEWADVGAIFTKENCDTGCCEGERKVAELWGLVRSFRAIVLAKSDDGNRAEVSGVQSLCHLRPEGDHMRGSISWKCEYRMGMTSLETFQLPDGRQVVADVIQVLNP
jgi:hypothetical protein